jgi:hypothetical protein
MSAAGAVDGPVDSGLSEEGGVVVAELEKAILLPSGDQTGCPRVVLVPGSE